MKVKKTTTNKRVSWGSLVSLLVTVLLAGIPFSISAEWMVMDHYPNGHTSGAARCLVAPTSSYNRLVIRRIRVTRDGAADVDISFVSQVSTDVAGLDYNLGTCTEPGCRVVLTLSGVQEGEVVEVFYSETT